MKQTIISQPLSQQGRDNYDNIFRKKDTPPSLDAQQETSGADHTTIYHHVSGFTICLKDHSTGTAPTDEGPLQL